MKVLLTYAATLNGKITKGADANVTKWTSKEDQALFKKIKASADVIIRSSKTYEASKTQSPQIGQLVVVLTRSPEKYKKVARPGALEFTNATPSKVIVDLQKRGFKNALVSVGGSLSSVFFQQKLIDRFYLTLEPKIFGSGVNMVGDLKLVTDLALVSSTKLNKIGTLLLKYRVVN